MANALATISTESTGLIVQRLATSAINRKCAPTSSAATAITKPQVDGVFASWPRSAAAKNGRFAASTKNTLATSSTCSTVAAIVKRGGAATNGAANGCAKEFCVITDDSAQRT